jgi:hypothetical protein
VKYVFFRNWGIMCVSRFESKNSKRNPPPTSKKIAYGYLSLALYVTTGLEA